jgi:hypothetical protein
MTLVLTVGFDAPESQDRRIYNALAWSSGDRRFVDTILGRR